MAGEKLREKAAAIHERLNQHYPGSKCTLDFKNPLQLLIATMLAAQCTDERVNIVTKDLFKKYKALKDFAGANPEEFMEDIRSTGFFRNKARNIIGMAQVVLEKHGGKVPDTLEDLTALPGVGRKTANVVLGNAFGIPGIVVDTHVTRVSGRLGLTKNTDAVKIEFDLMELFPERDWALVSHQLVEHGRALCNARKPLCGDCFLFDLCPHGQRLKKQAGKKKARRG